MRVSDGRIVLRKCWVGCWEAPEQIMSTSGILSWVEMDRFLYPTVDTLASRNSGTVWSQWMLQEIQRQSINYMLYSMVFCWKSEKHTFIASLVPYTKVNTTKGTDLWIKKKKKMPTKQPVEELELCQHLRNLLCPQTNMTLLSFLINLTSNTMHFYQLLWDIIHKVLSPVLADFT